MTERDSNWTKHLLRSSVPLEYEVAKILSTCGFNATFDFPYTRMDGTVDSERSVDVRGVRTIRLTDSIVGFTSFDMLVECKYREIGTSWLFLAKPDQVTARLGDIVCGVDYFSSKFLGAAGSTGNDKLPLCISAVEVRHRGGNDDDLGRINRAAESQLRKGLRQLQYAQPALIALRIESVAHREREHNFPFFFAPVLVTNAQLIVADPEFGIDAVRKASVPEDLGKVVTRLVWSAELGPDFEMHCQRKFARLPTLTKTAQMAELESYRQSLGESPAVLPTALARRIAADGGDVRELGGFTEILVVNVEALAETVTLLSEQFDGMSNSLRDVPIVRWKDSRMILPWEQ